jgi:hypothetical protein
MVRGFDLEIKELTDAGEFQGCQGRSKRLPLRRRKRGPHPSFFSPFSMRLGAAGVEPCGAR